MDASDEPDPGERNDVCEQRGLLAVGSEQRPKASCPPQRASHEGERAEARAGRGHLGGTDGAGSRKASTDASGVIAMFVRSELHPVGWHAIGDELDFLFMQVELSMEGCCQ